jgi:hypothetical protein
MKYTAPICLLMVIALGSGSLSAEPITISQASEWTLIVTKPSPMPDAPPPFDLTKLKTYSVPAAGNEFFRTNFHVGIMPGIKDLHIHLIHAGDVFAAPITSNLFKTARIRPGGNTVDLQGGFVPFSTVFSVQIIPKSGSIPTSFEVTPTVPEPSAMVLVGSGLVGLAARIRRRKNSASPTRQQ